MQVTIPHFAAAELTTDVNVIARFITPQATGGSLGLRWRRVAGVWAGVALAAAAATAAEPAAVLTLLEGEATLIIGARAQVAVPGARLTAGTLVETDAAAALLRLEWPDGSLLDLGPATRIVLRPAVAGSARGPLFYLLQGWAKQSQSALGAGQLSQAFDVPGFKGVLVSQVDGATAVLFAEAGSQDVAGRRGNGTLLTLRVGEAAVLGSDGTAQKTPRPPAGWLARIPRAFRDTLPPRLAQFKGPAPSLGPRGPLSYAMLQPWLQAESAVRRDFPVRFAELLADRAFRDAINARMDQHPEWEPVLRPPKPKPAASATR